MSEAFLAQITADLAGLRDDNLFKTERVIASRQGGEVTLSDGAKVLNFCANNYLGLAGDPRLIEAGQAALEAHGYGMASVRFICGTGPEHKALEQALAAWLGFEDGILYSSCFDANTGLFETLLGPEDAIISDALNHASIIDGVRLCKAQRFRYDNNDMADLERCLQDASGARFRLIATDGVFSMDGILADLPAICDLAERYGAMVMVDDSHAVGVLGPEGRGTAAALGVEGRIDILTGTLGKAMGGASGGYTLAKAPVVEWLRQRSRPYLFSNTLAPVIAEASLTALDLVRHGDDLRAQLNANAAQFRSRMAAEGFTLAGQDHPIIPVMLNDAGLASDMAQALGRMGIYVTAFAYPVVPKGRARIRTQMSAAHSHHEVDRLVEAFVAARKECEK